MTSARKVDHMKPGFYKLNLAKGAPDVGALIYIPCPIEMHPEFWNVLDRPMHKQAMINGRPVEVWRIGNAFCEKIKQPEYEFLIADRAWAEANEPDSPEANPYTKVEKPTKQKQTETKPRIKITSIPIKSLMP